jgi:hypothetical protein
MHYAAPHENEGLFRPGKNYGASQDMVSILPKIGKWVHIFDKKAGQEQTCITKSLIIFE